MGGIAVGIMSFLGHVVGWFFTAAHWHGSDGIPHRVEQHLAISAVSVAVAVAVALPLALWLGHIGKGGFAAVSLANIGRAVPSFALLVLGFKIFGFGPLPIFLALWALSVPPILVNAITAISQVDRDVTEAAVGMGMTGWQVLSRVEFPSAVPLIFAGIRTASVQAVATAALGAVVSWGGVGRYIIDGFAQQDYVKLVAGAFIVALLSFLTEVGLARLQRALTPVGLRIQPGVARKVSAMPGAVVASEVPVP
ncbi:MAG: ABC transporter permease [Actinomycetota bacterium]|nr:ABC transporter permease [Actinomycetota bacterium]